MSFDNTIAIDQNYGSLDALRYMTPGGSCIDGAQIRVYLKSDYDARKLNCPVGITITKADGRWKDPVLVVPGFTYTVRFEKPNYFGPDTVDIIA